jgi:formamidopyrimidine-DNA glycosylase
MPELPEVETIARQLNTKLVNKKISRVDIFNENSFQGSVSEVVGRSVLSIERKAKTLIFELSGDLMLLVHLKMTGQLIYQEGASRVAGGHPSHDFHSELPNKHTRVVIGFGENETLFFNDMRKFGWVRVVDGAAYKKYFDRFGPDAVPSINLDYLKARALRMPRSTIKKFILDQNVISGVGNIYADEALFDARIHPSRLVSNINEKEWKLLSVCITDKLLFAIEKGGTTDNDYVNAYGEKGGMQEFLNVYHKKGAECPRNCGGRIEKIRVAGRGTHFCPVCQKEKK